MYKLTIFLILYLIPFQALAAEHVSVSDLLDKYQMTRSSFQSFFVKDITTTISTDTIESGRRLSREVSTFYNEGDRVGYRTNIWSNLMTEYDPTPMEEAGYKSFIWNGESYFQIKIDRDGTSRAFIKEHDGVKLAQVAVSYRGAPLMGIFFGDDKPVDLILRQDENISVRNDPEKVGESECYVIDALTQHGKYTVWIDPYHGYNIVKAEVEKNRNDLSWEGKTINELYRPPPSSINVKNPPGSMENLSFSLKNVRFEKIDDVWIPMEADYQFKQIHQDGRIITVDRHHKRTIVDFNPDFESAGAFVPDIPDGTKVYVEGVEGIQYKWQNGKLTPDIDKAVIDELDKITEKILAEDKVHLGQPTDRKTKAAPNERATPIDTESQKQNERATPTDTEPKKQVDTVKSTPVILSEYRSSLVLVLILIGLPLIIIIIWLVLRLHKA